MPTPWRTSTTACGQLLMSHNIAKMSKAIMCIVLPTRRCAYPVLITWLSATGRGQPLITITYQNRLGCFGYCATYGRSPVPWSRFADLLLRYVDDRTRRILNPNLAAIVLENYGGACRISCRPLVHMQGVYKFDNWLTLHNLSLSQLFYIFFKT